MLSVIPNRLALQSSLASIESDEQEDDNNRNEQSNRQI